MISQIWGLARNDLSVWLRSPAAIAAALLPALGLGLLVAVLTNSVGQQPVALVVPAKSRFAERMSKILQADAEAYLLTEMSAVEAEHAIGEQKVAAIIALPENFDDAVESGDARVDLYLNNVDIDLADDLRRSVTRSVAEFDAPQLGLIGELHGPSEGVLLPNPYRIALAEHDLRQTNVSFLQYQVIPTIVLVIISIGLLGTALLTARDFGRGTAKLMILSPAGRLPLVLGRLLGGVSLTTVMVAPLLGLGILANHISACDAGLDGFWSKLLLSGPCAGRLSVPSWEHGVAVGALLLALTFTTVGCGTLLGIAVRDERLVSMAALNVSAYLFFLGGGFTTVAFLPDPIRLASRFVPTSYAIEGLRQALFYPDLAGFGKDLAILAACAALSILLASLALHRALRKV